MVVQYKERPEGEETVKTIKDQIYLEVKVETEKIHEY